MTMQTQKIDEWLDKAFRLAFFLHGRRETAKRIAAGAMNKLETASVAQFKRHYYTPVGRAENSRAARSRVSLSDLQLLQRLVFVESEGFEREKEAAKQAGEENLLKFFVKHLVRITLKRNSFYVTLAVSRILHNYGTADAMEIYNVVVQDPERVHDDYYYRSRKAVLMKELKARFGGLLETVKANRGEERFLTRNKSESENLSETARESLKFFTPWNSECAIPEKFNPFDDIIKPFYFDKTDPDAEHQTEVRRIHAALHPNCFNRLTAALNLPAPAEKMELPKFMTNTNPTEYNDNDWRNPPHLEAYELQQIKDVLTAQAESRKALTAGFLRVAAGGAERARIVLAETGTAKFDLGEDAELIEIYAGDDSGEMLLATHLLNFSELERGNQIYTARLEGGQKVSFKIAPVKDEYGEITGFKCAAEYAETVWRKRFALALRRAKFAFARRLDQPNPILKPAFAFGLILLAAFFGWFVFRNSGERKTEFVRENITPNQNGAIKIPESAPKENETAKDETAKDEIADKNAAPNPANNNQSDPKRIKKTQIPSSRQPNIADKPEPAPKRENTIQSPPKQLQAENQNRRNESNGTDENGVLRVPIRENNSNFPNQKNTTRTAKIRGKSLAEMRRFYVETTGDEILGGQIREQLSAEFQKSNRFSIAANKEDADGRLIIYIRHESDGDEPEDKSATAIVRLVNAEGFVVFPNRKNISAWKYVGVIGKLPPRIARDLAAGK